jgi:hypothetical protein
MPGYKSKTQSKKNLKSSNKAKNGGRRRKQTMKKVRRGRKVMRGGVGGWVPSTMTQVQQNQFNDLLYTYFADKATGKFDTDTITKLETQDKVAEAIFDKMEALNLKEEEKDKAYKLFEPFFPEK